MAKSGSTAIIGVFALILCGACTPKSDQSTDEYEEETFDEVYTPETRMNIAGDFNGDERIDTVFESFISAETGKELSRAMDSVEERNIELINQSHPVSRLYSNLTGIDTLVVSKDAQQMGIGEFANLGNINNVPGDELGYIIAWADQSNLNTYHIVTLKGKKWETVLEFPINEMVSFDRDNLFENQGIVIKDGKGFRYKFYSDSATVEEARFEK